MLFHRAMSNLDIKVTIYKQSTTSTISTNTTYAAYTNTKTSTTTYHIIKAITVLKLGPPSQ